MHTPWRRFALFGAAFVVLAATNGARAVGEVRSGSGTGVLPLVGAVLMTLLAFLFLRQAVLRRRATRGQDRSPRGASTDPG